MNDAQWAKAHETFYSLRLLRHMGTDPNAIPEKPTLLNFYSNIMSAIEAGKFKAWAVLDANGDYLGHSILDKTSGEWEMGAVIADENRWSSGIGVKAALTALKWAFEEDGAEWVVSFVTSTDPRVKGMVERGGFKPLFHFHVMHRDTWYEKWHPRMGRI